ncbi:MAG: hypothetical protein ACTTK2_02620 [Hoylesella marshii]|jgi:adenylate kinase|uniref:Uncharacterized protein n=1 Tax=Hoylesella marshii DSM 16973 = JCM 13450 TaxID=862515 RepID=E0NUM6_9BACT|nr:hypothetical protein [Hoylesella marshii]EFM01133.1 hypothetical protein HMPREF0658_1881 [Hoylesella marshii DSM 16973 = JCM 13450]
MINKFGIFHILMFAVITGGLIYITESWMMSLGILLLLLIGDYIIGYYAGERRRGKNQDDENKSIN